MLYGFDRLTSRELVRLLYDTRKQVEQLSAKVARGSSYNARAAADPPPSIVIPKTTLQVGESCKGYLVKYDGTDMVASKYLVTVEDHLEWGFAVGTDDYASTIHKLPVRMHPLTKTWIVSAPSNLIQQAKPDSTITTGNTGTFSIYQDGTDTTVNVTANVTWGDNAEGVTSGKESWVRWNGAQWEWVGGDCE